MKLKKRKGYIDICDLIRGFLIFAIFWTVAIFGMLFASVMKKVIHDYSPQYFQNVTLYDNTGQIVGQWMGDFSVTRNGDTTQIKNSERVIEITGGIVIAEGN